MLRVGVERERERENFHIIDEEIYVGGSVCYVGTDGLLCTEKSRYFPPSLLVIKISFG